MQWLGTMMPRSYRHTLAIEDLGDVVRVHPRHTKRRHGTTVGTNWWPIPRHFGHFVEALD